MAAYAYSVTSDMRKVAKLGDVVGYAMYAGQVNITNYNATTKPEITEISDKFKSVIAVTFACSDSGQVFRWDAVNNTIECFASGGTAGVPLAEEATDTDCGEASFIAMGLI